MLSNHENSPDLDSGSTRESRTLKCSPAATAIFHWNWVQLRLLRSRLLLYSVVLCLLTAGHKFNDYFIWEHITNGYQREGAVPGIEAFVSDRTTCFSERSKENLHSCQGQYHLIRLKQCIYTILHGVPSNKAIDLRQLVAERVQITP